MRYAYIFVAAAVTGLFTIAGLAGSYTRMLAKAESINHMRDELAMTRNDYAHLEKRAHEKDVQAASLSSLATEVSAIYGLTAGKLTLLHGHDGRHARPAAIAAAKAPLKDDTTALNDEGYSRSVDLFMALQNTASQGVGSQAANPSLGVRALLSTFAILARRMEHPCMRRRMAASSKPLSEMAMGERFRSIMATES